MKRSTLMFMFEIFPIIFTIMFVLILCVFIVTFAGGIKEWNKNNHSPRLTVDAAVISKRTNISRHRHDRHTQASTTYYVTFEVESGDRMELRLSGSEYGLLIEGDRGKLSFQGTRYLGFERI